MFEQLDTLESLSTCEGEVLKRKRSIENMLAAQAQTREKTDVKMTKLVKALANYKMKELFALSEKSEQINHLCTTDPFLQNKWSSHLKKIGGYPSESFTSFDKAETCNNFETLKGVVLLSSLQKYPKLTMPAAQLLNKACDFRLYQALVRRLKTKVGIIKECIENAFSREKTNVHIQSALKDAFKLSNLYWSMGCVDSAMSLIDIATHLTKKNEHKLPMQRFSRRKYFTWSKHYEADDMPQTIEILKTAIEMLCTSQIISSFPESQKIAMEITDNKGILSGFKAFKTPEELHRKLLTILGKFSIPKPHSFISLAYENALRYVKNHYPHYEEIASSKVKNHMG